jgi:hypothetical protein
MKAVVLLRLMFEEGEDTIQNLEGFSLVDTYPRVLMSLINQLL